MNTDKLAKRYASFAMFFRNEILIATIIVVIVAAYFIKDIDIRNDPEMLFPADNKYIATNNYINKKFGSGNILVTGFVLKDCANVADNLKITTKTKCMDAGGTWQRNDSAYSAWFVNMLREAHLLLANNKHAEKNKFIDIYAKNIKSIGVDKEGGLSFKRLVHKDGISSNKKIAKQQLQHLKEGVESNNIIAPMLIVKRDKENNKCNFKQNTNECIAKGFFIVGEYKDSVKYDYKQWINNIDNIINNLKQKYSNKVDIMISGEPYFLATMIRDLSDKLYLFAISVLITLLALWIANKNWKGAVLPMLGILATIVITLGLMGYSGYRFTTMMVLTPMLLLAVGTGHAMQVVRRYLLEHNINGLAPNKAAEEVISKIIKPATLAIITDMAGFFTLSFVDISFYKAYAYFGMFGMLTIIITTTTITPILMAKFSSNAVKNKSNLKLDSKLKLSLLGFIASTILTKLKIIPIVLVAVIIGWSIYQTKIYKATENNLMPGLEVGIDYPNAAFKYDTQVNIDLRKLNNNMPGVISINIPIRGKKEFHPILKDCANDADGIIINRPCYDNEEDPPKGAFNHANTLKAVDKLESWMVSHPNIGFAASYAQVIKTINMLMMTKDNKPDIKFFNISTQTFIQNNLNIYGDEDDDEFIPDADNIIASFNGIIEASFAKEDLLSFISTDWNEIVIRGFINTMNPIKTHQIIKDIQQFIADNKDKEGFKELDFGYIANDKIIMPKTNKTIIVEDGNDKIAVGGFLGVIEATRDIAKKELFSSPIITIITIAIITFIIFSSIRISIILTTILFITLFAQYALGAYFSSIENWAGNLHFATLVSLPISMGLGVDYSIYIIARLKEEMSAKKDWQLAVKSTIKTTGAAIFISITALIVSFIPLMLTQLANTWALSIFILEALVIDIVLALTIVPIFIYWSKSKYVFGK